MNGFKRCYYKRMSRNQKSMAIFMIISFIMICFCSCDSSVATESSGEGNAQTTDTSTILESEEQQVRNGHLGNYDTVTVDEVFSYLFPDGEWKSFESLNKSNEVLHIVQFKGTMESVGTMLIQFWVHDDKTFSVVHYDVDGQAKTTPYNIKKDLDELYGFYKNSHPSSGIEVDFSTKNDTVTGACASD